jgi:hypothetical protein
MKSLQFDRGLGNLALDSSMPIPRRRSREMGLASSPRRPCGWFRSAAGMPMAVVTHPGPVLPWARSMNGTTVVAIEGVATATTPQVTRRAVNHVGVLRILPKGTDAWLPSYAGSRPWRAMRASRVACVTWSAATTSPPAPVCSGCP